MKESKELIQNEKNTPNALPKEQVVRYGQGLLGNANLMTLIFQLVYRQTQQSESKDGQPYQLYLVCRAWNQINEKMFAQKVSVECRVELNKKLAQADVDFLKRPSYAQYHYYARPKIRRRASYQGGIGGATLDVMKKDINTLLIHNDVGEIWGDDKLDRIPLASLHTIHQALQALSDEEAGFMAMTNLAKALMDNYTKYAHKAEADTYQKINLQCVNQLILNGVNIWKDGAFFSSQGSAFQDLCRSILRYDDSLQNPVVAQQFIDLAVEYKKKRQVIESLLKQPQFQQIDLRGIILRHQRIDLISLASDWTAEEVCARHTLIRWGGGKYTSSLLNRVLKYGTDEEIVAVLELPGQYSITAENLIVAMKRDAIAGQKRQDKIGNLCSYGDLVSEDSWSEESEDNDNNQSPLFSHLLFDAMKVTSDDLVGEHGSLFDIIEFGDLRLLEKALAVKGGIDASVLNKKGQTPLVYAISLGGKDGMLDKIRVLIEKLPLSAHDVCRVMNGRSVLHRLFTQTLLPRAELFQSITEKCVDALDFFQTDSHNCTPIEVLLNTIKPVNSTEKPGLSWCELDWVANLLNSIHTRDMQRQYDDTQLLPRVVASRNLQLLALILARDDVEIDFAKPYQNHCTLLMMALHNGYNSGNYSQLYQLLTSGRVTRDAITYALDSKNYIHCQGKLFDQLRSDFSSDVCPGIAMLQMVEYAGNEKISKAMVMHIRKAIDQENLVLLKNLIKLGKINLFEVPGLDCSFAEYAYNTNKTQAAKLLVEISSQMLGEFEQEIGLSLFEAIIPEVLENSRAISMRNTELKNSKIGQLMLRLQSIRVKLAETPESQHEAHASMPQL